MLTVIIIFIAMMIIIAAILAMGAIPKIFQNAEVITDTQNETKNQTEIIIKQFQRENNTTQKILSNQNSSLINQAYLLQSLSTTIDHIDSMADQILNISSELQSTRDEHDRIVVEAQNTTNHVEQELERYGENSIEKLDIIVENQEKILKLLNGTN